MARARIVAERELKLSAYPELALPDLARVVKGATTAAPVTTELDAVYFDTADLRLLRRGVTVRHRRGEAGGNVWTVKLPSAAPAIGLARREVSLPGTPTAMPPLVRDLTRGWAFGAPLARVARMHTTRTTTGVLSDAGELIAVVDDDLVVGSRGRRVTARFREIEVELAPDAPDKVLRPIANALHAAGALPADQVPKLVHLLGPEARGAWDLAPVQRGARANAGDVVHARLVAAAAELVDRCAAVVLAEAPDAPSVLGDAVARLRAEVRAGRALLDDVAAVRLDDSLARLLAALDALAVADAAIACVGNAAGPGAASLARAVDAVRNRRGARLLAHLRSSDHRDLLGHLRTLALEPPLVPGKAKRRRPTVRGAQRKAAGRMRADLVAAPPGAVAERVGDVRDVLAIVAADDDAEARRLADDAAVLAAALGGARRAREVAALLESAARGVDARAAFLAGRIAGAALERADRAERDAAVGLAELGRKSRWASLG